MKLTRNHKLLLLSKQSAKSAVTMRLKQKFVFIKLSWFIAQFLFLIVQYCGIEEMVFPPKLTSFELCVLKLCMLQKMRRSAV